MCRAVRRKQTTQKTMNGNYQSMDGVILASTIKIPDACRRHPRFTWLTTAMLRSPTLQTSKLDVELNNEDHSSKQNIDSPKLRKHFEAATKGREQAQRKQTKHEYGRKESQSGRSITKPPNYQPKIYPTKHRVPRSTKNSCRSGQEW